MKIDEAIEILEELVDDSWSYMETEENSAAKLGIEALKRLKHERAVRIPFWANQLPGETEE